MADTHRFAFIGCGKRARKAFVTGIKVEPRVEVVAAADLQEEAATELLAEAGFPDAPVFTDHQAMLAAVKPEYVITPLWTGLHFPMFKDCVEAGVKAVICEKPMAATWGDCRAMAELAESSGVQLTFCHQRRFAAGNRLARKLVAEGVFGEIKRMDLVSPKSLLDCGTHTFDQAMSLNDEQPMKWVLGAIDTTEFMHSFGLYSEIMAEGTIVFANGVRATLQVGGGDLDIWTGVRVIGSKGFFEIDWGGNFGEVVVYADPAYRVPEVEVPDGVEMAGVLSDAIDSLRSGDEPELSHRKALRSMEIIYGLYESVRRRQLVSMPLEIEDHPLTAMIESGEVVVPEASRA